MPWLFTSKGCLVFGLVVSVLFGCTTKYQLETVNLDSIDGKTMDEVIELEGTPVTRTENQLVYEYETRERVTPYGLTFFCWVLLVEVAV